MSQQPIQSGDAKAANGLNVVTNMTTPENKPAEEKEAPKEDKSQSANDVMQKFSNVLSQLKQRSSQTPLQEVERLREESADGEDGEELSIAE